jgi:hypothetical protein
LDRIDAGSLSMAPKRAEPCVQEPAQVEYFLAELPFACRQRVPSHPTPRVKQASLMLLAQSKNPI